MFRSLGISSGILFSLLVASPFAMAEESQAFVAQNQARHAAFEQHEEVLAAKAAEHLKTQQASTYNPQTEGAKHT